jgi:S-DNA-T family DNA segregation ATPase FtsK/SpoIIIE
VPVLASIVPVLGAVALWVVTGSILSLWLALLGPLIAGATMLDSARGVRRDRRRAARVAADARERVAASVQEYHAEERARLWARHPDAASYAIRRDEVWRAVPGRSDVLVVGSGARASDVRVTGGDGDDESMRLRSRAATLEAAPVTIPIVAGLAVVGPPVLAGAVVRALVVQACAALPPGRLRIVGPLAGEHAWAEMLPQRRAADGVALALVGPDDAVPPDAELVLAHARVPVPGSCAAVLTVTSPGEAELDYAGEVVPLAVEGLARSQAEHLARDLSQRALAVLGEVREDGPVLLEPLLAQAPARGRGVLPAIVGVQSGRPVVIDLVDDGPHAVVAGVTGSGKSELLITWILALCATHSTNEVNFLLADFKGGTAFDALAGIPHVTGVITDLDGAGARRAIESLRAEVRWREAELARFGARDLRDPRVQLPRLVVVVDEFAALLGAHPELQAVFTDVAARGRALGLHLVLGTQRVAGVIRDALLTNCPLRLSLRVTDDADSRAVIGTPDAARLAGGPHGRGLALVRRGGDTVPQGVRIALSTPADVRAICARDVGPRPRRPWLPDLPALVTLGDVRAGRERAEGIVLGVVDEPDQQRQRAEVLRPRDRGLLILGAAGRGRTAALRTIATQAAGDAVWIPSAGEGAWDAVARLTDGPPRRGSVILIDDLDALAARFPHDYAAVLLERVEHLVRTAGDTGALVVATAQRPTAAAGRVADLLPRRALLGMTSRADYVGAGGDPAHFVADAPPGRGRLDGRAIQFAWTPPSEAGAVTGADVGAGVGAAPGTGRSESEEDWMPGAALTGFVARRSAAARAVASRWETAGATVIRVAEFVAERGGDGAPERMAGTRVVVVGDPEEWQRQWATLARIRGEHDLVIDAACGPEYRIVAGDRELPPYCEPGGHRAWLRREDGPAVRIRLPSPARTGAPSRRAP